MAMQGKSTKNVLFVAIIFKRDMLEPIYTYWYTTNKSQWYLCFAGTLSRRWQLRRGDDSTERTILSR